MVTVMDEPGVPARLPETIGPITVAEIAGGDLQEGQGLDFKREVHVDKPEAKARLADTCPNFWCVVLVVVPVFPVVSTLHKSR